MEAFLVKYDEIDGVYAGDDNMGVGALNAAKAAGREGIIFVGATNFAVGYEAMGRASTGARSTSPLSTMPRRR
jgi:ribose transport system substrate-binding protein